VTQRSETGVFVDWTIINGMMVLWAILIATGFYLLHDLINECKEELSPLEILKKRLAKGEITAEEFERLSKKL
jgi:putative membrane protein